MKRFLGIFVFAVILWGGEYFRRGLWEPDEARYAYVAREMRENGNWFIPTRHGEVYPDKPPLMFWLMNVGSLATGGRITRLSVRLPSLLGAVLSLWGVAFLAARWKGRGAAVKAVMVLSTASLFWQKGGMGQIEALLCGLEVMAFVLLVLGSEGVRGSLPYVGAYGCMGLAVLAKGPVGIVVPLGAFVTAMLAGGHRDRLKGWHWVWGPLLAAAIPLAWIGAAWMQGGGDGYLQDVVLDQTAKRIVGGTGHRAPFYYYAWHFPLEFLPWTVLLPAALVLPAATDLDRNRRRFLLGWVLWVLVLFSLPADKRELYVLFAYPAAALLVALAWEDWARLPVAWDRNTFRAAAGLLLIVAMAGFGAAFVDKIPFDGRLLWPLSVAIVLGMIVMAWLRTRGAGRWIYGLASTLLVVQIYVGSVVYPSLNPLKTPWELGETARSVLPAGQKLVILGIQGEILALYAERPGWRVMDRGQLAAAMKAQGRGIVATSARVWAHSRAGDLRADMVVHPFRMGNKEMVWVEFDASRSERRGGHGVSSPSKRTVDANRGP